MSKAAYQFNDFLGFLGEVANEHTDFAIDIHEKLMKMGCKVKISATKAYPYQLAYTMPNSRKGILNFYLRKKGLKMRVTIIDPENHQDLLNRLPEKMVAQIEKKNVCRKLTEGCECLETCIGYDFRIGETHHQKCRFDGFKFDVDAESIPFLFELLESEIKCRKDI